jgi:uncharacterized protein (TIGR03118 family)
MRLVRPPLALAVVLMSALAAVPASAQFYEQHDLVSDASDGDLVNPWGLVSGPTTPWWVSDNGTDLSTLYNAAGVKQGLVVSVPGAPTGAVFNAGPLFVLGPANNSGGKTGKAVFLFATEDGAIWAWNNTGVATQAVMVGSTADAVYKGLAIAQIDGTHARLYATNFHAGTVDVFDEAFAPVANAGFVDPDLPAGYAPFGIQTIGDMVIVTYALQDEHKEDDVAGQGHGIVDAFDTAGHWAGRLAAGGTLNSPWGIALAPDTFGRYAGHLLIGNFGSGRIDAFDVQHRLGDGRMAYKGMLHGADGRPLVIEGLWALSFGKGAANNGAANALYFTAGPADEAGGLFGFLSPSDGPGH